MFDFTVLKNINYFFEARPSVGSFGLLVPLLIFFGLMLVLAIYLKVVYGIYAKKMPYYNDLGERLFGWLSTISILGLLYIFLRYEGIMYLSARVVIIAIILIFLYWGYFVWKFYQTQWLPKKEKFHSKKDMKRYMPKKKKK